MPPTSSTPYGEWPSPVSAELVAGGAVDIGHLALDGSEAFWRERRPQENGRGVVVHDTNDGPQAVTPDDANVRTLVHEYGGADFTIHDDVVYYVCFDDQRVYRQPLGSSPEPITPAPGTERGLRYADFELTDDGHRVYCVREDHDATAGEDGAPEPVTTLVTFLADGSGSPEVVASGHDFYAAPRLSPDGEQLAWLTWDHPRMPWDGTELHVGSVAGDDSVAAERTVLGGSAESVVQPAWRPDGTLHAVSDRTGWWNLYRWEDESWEAYGEEPAEYGFPQWQFGLATYAFLGPDTVAARVTRRGEHSIELLTPGGGREVTDLPYAVVWPQVRSDGRSLYLLVGGPASPQTLVRWQPGEEPVVVYRARELDLDPAYVSSPAHLAYPTRDGAEAYVYHYPPTNPDVEPPAGERPPLLVIAHGGPTGQTQPSLNLAVQYFTSRGFAVADVNYRGSAGYGREFRDALKGNWGVMDVEDCIDAGKYLAEQGRVDDCRLAVRGGSAGGFVVLAALSFHDAFAAGTSYYGVADLERLWELTHKFESRYLDQLVGPYPDAAETYAARSPVHHAGDIDVPVLLLQGEDDQVVPLSQAEAMSAALEAGAVPHEIRVFEDEQHGFRRAETRRRALETELAFYGQVLGFEPADDLPELELSPAP